MTAAAGRGVPTAASFTETALEFASFGVGALLTYAAQAS